MWKWKPSKPFTPLAASVTVFPHIATLTKTEGVALLKEVYHWGQALRFQKPIPFPATLFCLILVALHVSSQLLLQHQARLPAVLLPTMLAMNAPFETISLFQ